MATRKRSKRSKLRMAQDDMANLVDLCSMERRELIIAQPIDSTVMHYLAKVLGFLEAQSREPITVLLNTPGGTVVDGLAVYDLLKHYARRVPIHIIAMGACMSMGMIILQAATKRLATPHTAFLLHEVQGMNVGALSKMQDVHQEMERMQRRLNKLVCERSGITETKLRRLFERKEYFLDASEALKHNLIDSIVE